MSISFFQALTYSFAMTGTILSVIPLLGYFKISIHWINELYMEHRVVRRFDRYYFFTIVYHLLLLIGTLLVMNFDILKLASISNETFSTLFLPFALAGSGNLLSWLLLFWRVYQERQAVGEVS